MIDGFNCEWNACVYWYLCWMHSNVGVCNNTCALDWILYALTNKLYKDTTPLWRSSTTKAKSRVDIASPWIALPTCKSFEYAHVVIKCYQMIRVHVCTTRGPQLSIGWSLIQVLNHSHNCHASYSGVGLVWQTLHYVCNIFNLYKSYIKILKRSLSSEKNIKIKVRRSYCLINSLQKTQIKYQNFISYRLLNFGSQKLRLNLIKVFTLITMTTRTSKNKCY